MRGKWMCSVWALLLISVSYRVIAGVNQWTSNGPDGGIVVDVVYDPTNASIVYAASQLSVYKSTDGGTNWSLLKEDFGDYAIADLVLDPSDHNRLYVAALGGGVFRSNNAGATFSRISAIPVDANTDGPNGLAVSADGLTIYYSTISGRFYRSTDGGQTWSERTKAATGGRTLVLKPGDANTVFLQGFRVYKSVDGGGSWADITPLTTPTPPTGPAPIAANGLAMTSGAPNKLWCTSYNTVFVSSNEGTSWTVAYAPLGTVSLGPIIVDPNTPGNLVLAPAYSSGLLYQYNGTTWSPFGTSLPSTWSLAIAPGSSATMLATHLNGILRTTNTGASWSSSHTGIHATTNRILANSGVRTYAGHQWIALSYSANGGPWQSVSLAGITPSPNPYFDSLAVHPTTPNTLFVGIQQGGLWRSTNGGASWNQVTSIPTMSRVHSIVFDPFNANTLYATASGLGSPIAAVHKSVDGGAAFTPVSTGVSSPFPYKLIADPQNSGRLFLGGGDYDTRGLLRSTDGGVTWTNTIGNIPTFDLALDVTDSRRVYATTGGIQASTDNGLTWTNMASFSYAEYGSAFLIAVDPTLGSNLYVVSSKCMGPICEWFIMRSADSGQSWERIANQPPPSWGVTQLTINPNAPTKLLVAIAEHGVQEYEIAPDFSVAIAGHGGFKGIGVSSSFDVRVQNAGPLSASDLKLAIQVPTNLQNVSATIDRGTCAVGSGSVNCSIPFIHKDELATARVTYTAVVAGSLDVQATVSAHERDPALADNTASAFATVAELVDLQLTGSATPAATFTGEAAVYAFQVMNAGPSVSSATRVSIQLPAGVAATTVSPASCSLTVLTVDCNLGALSAGAAVSISVNVTSNATGALQATASASIASAAVETNTANNSATVTLTTSARPSSGGGGGGGGGGIPLDMLWLLCTCALLRRLYD